MQLTAFARAQGLSDIRFARADDMPLKNNFAQPRALLDSAACIVVLFAAYRPAAPPPPGSMALSAYYIASHFSYMAARAVEAYLKQHGAQALHTTAISAKGAALRTGGFMGDNGFYYHQSLGSFVCIQTVLTDAFEAQDDIQNADGCLHCGECAAACPSHAVSDMGRCLRRYLNGEVPEELRDDVYQLLGCEKCQSACPLNGSLTSAPICFSLETLLSGEATKALRRLAGPNMARRGRLISQGVLYAAVTGQKQLLGQITRLAENEGEPIRTHARWAIKKLGNAD